MSHAASLPNVVATVQFYTRPRNFGLFILDCLVRHESKPINTVPRIKGDRCFFSGLGFDRLCLHNFGIKLRYLGLLSHL